MKSLRYILIVCMLMTKVWANPGPKSPQSTASTYNWALTSPSAITLYQNISQSGVGFIYTSDPGSDLVIIRCPLNDIGLQQHQTYVCYLFPGESAKIELKKPYFSRGAHGTYSLLF